MANGHRKRALSCTAAFLAAACALLAPQTATAITPDSPEVVQLVNRALKSLETLDDVRLGGKCLIGLSFYKAGAPLTHPKIVAAQKACETGLAESQSTPSQAPPTEWNYSVGLALIFLLETDPEKNRALAQRYVAEALKRQKPNGAWGYDGEDLGDTSQTQYPVLGLWLAANHGIDVPSSAIERTCIWLVKTQDVSGAWGYKGTEPATFQRMQQGDVRPSVAAAGLGSLYICADLLGITTTRQPQPTDQPSALRAVETDTAKSARGFVTKAIDHQLVRRAMDDGNQWFAKNYTTQSEPWTHYYLYALERYHSFRELAERRSDPNPRWYNDVVAMLRQTQQTDGFWTGTDSEVISTSFSLLCLLRSARKTISRVAGDLGKGVLLGGMGLPANTAELRERDGKLVEKQLAGSLDELLALIEKPGDTDLDRLIASAESLALDSDVTKRSGQIARLRSLVSAGAFEPRLVAVRTLGRVRELDNVPLLIYALTDPDVRIVLEADKGLRFISRKLTGVGLAEEPKPEDIKASIAAWKAWYLSIRPSARFLD
jgi:hypothetical protein